MNEEIKSQIQACKDMIKGRLAEAIVEELFKVLGYSVHRYGIENTLPSILHCLSQFRDNKIIDKARSLPDMIITKSDKAYEIEVKYRENAQFTYDQLQQQYPEYPHVDVLFVVVSPNAIKCISFQELKAGASIKSGPHNLLGERPEFKDDKDTIRYYAGFVKNIFNEGLKNSPNGTPVN